MRRNTMAALIAGWMMLAGGAADALPPGWVCRVDAAGTVLEQVAGRDARVLSPHTAAETVVAVPYESLRIPAAYRTPGYECTSLLRVRAGHVELRSVEDLRAEARLCAVRAWGRKLAAAQIARSQALVAAQTNPNDVDAAAALVAAQLVLDGVRAQEPR